ncbi:MAG: DUF934 domain-containing protein [Pseudomonadota bacterium]
MSQVITPTGFAKDAWADIALPTIDEYEGGAGVLLPVDAAPEAALPHFDTLKLIVVPFGSSADGRGFSQAAQLRGLGFTGHIRARGHVLVDQFRAALRSGFTDIEITDEQAARNPEHQWVSVPMAAGYQSRVFGGEVRP